MRVWIGFIWLGRENTVTGSCKHDNEPAASTEGGKFLDQCREYVSSLQGARSVKWISVR